MVSFQCGLTFERVRCIMKTQTLYFLITFLSLNLTYAQSEDYFSRDELAFQALISPQMPENTPYLISILNDEERNKFSGHINALDVATTGMLRGALDIVMKHAMKDHQVHDRMALTPTDKFDFKTEDFDLDQLLKK